MRYRKLRLDRIVVKSNDLIPALASLSLNELRLLAFCLSNVKREFEEFNIIKVKSSELADTFNISVDSIYSLVKDLMIRINSKPLELQTEKKDSIVFWFKSLDRYKDIGIFEFEFHPRLKPYLLQLRDNFTSYRIKDIYQFRAASTWHIYEVLRQYKNMKIKEFDINDFKSLIGVSDSYRRFSNLKDRLLDPALDDINSFSDINVSYKTLKTGLHVTGLRFVISDNLETLTPGDKARRITAKIKTPNPCPDLGRLLREDYGVAPRNAYKLCIAAGGSRANQKRLRDQLPGIKARYDALEVKSQTLGGYVFASLCQDVSRQILV